MKDYTDEFSFIVKPSSIEGAGIGIFAIQGIKAGTKLCLNKEGGESRTLDPDEVPEVFKSFCITLPDGKLKAPKEFNHLWIVWYLNHSNTPNIELRQPENNYYSIRDIEAGEELLVDYNAAFDQPEEAKKEFYK